MFFFKNRKFHIKFGEGDIKNIISLMLFPNKADFKITNKIQQNLNLNKRIPFLKKTGPAGL